MASVASCIDNGRRLAVPKAKALHSVFYAALRRGRAYENSDNGGIELFEHAFSKIIRGNVNPLVDPILHAHEEFAPEYAFLAREAEAYTRDLQRAGTGVANVQRSLVPFGDFYEPIAQLPLLDINGNLRPSSTSMQDQTYSQVDAIYLRDPESLLFKEWARLDLDHSPSGRGFQFTAIANSNGRPDAAINSTDYYFALVSCLL